MLSSLRFVHRLGSLLLCLVAFLSSQSPAPAQTKNNQDANLTDQEKLRRILAKVNKQQRDASPAPDTKSSAAALAAIRIAEASKDSNTVRQIQDERNRAAGGVLRSIERTGVSA